MHSEAQSALVSGAHATLRHPLRRAVYLVRARRACKLLCAVLCKLQPSQRTLATSRKSCSGDYAQSRWLGSES